MNKVQLEKASAILAKIETLESHILRVKTVADNEKHNANELSGEPMAYPKLREESGGHLQINTWHRKGGGCDFEILHSDFTNTQEFLFLYIVRAEQKLAQLKKEFEAI